MARVQRKAGATWLGHEARDTWETPSPPSGSWLPFPWSLGAFRACPEPQGKPSEEWGLTIY